MKISDCFPSRRFRPLWILLTLWSVVRGAEADWAWVGAVRTDGARLNAGWMEGGAPDLRISARADLAGARSVEGRAREAGPLGTVVTYDLSGLRPDTEYHYGWGDGAFGRFRTFPEGQADLVVALAACASTGSSHPVFDAIAEQNPLFFLQMGDLHYEDIRQNELDRFRRAYLQVFASPRQNALLRRMPWVHMWDDHDYGPNNSHAGSPSREAALAAYREVVPHYPLALGEAAEAPVAQAFTVGRVRFILTDLRSAKRPGETMMGGEQLEWFKNEILRAHRTHALVVWLSSVPWVSPAGSSRDNWGGFAKERREIADFMVEHGIENICAVSGDAHMLAFDDGSHNTYASDGEGPGFPVFQAAALDRGGSVKGGPYSGGTHPGGGQFGVLRIRDRGEAVEVEFEGRNHRGDVVIRHTFRRPVDIK